MSVTNPEKIVTKQDLADFYGEILPYLGGMPDILANKFNKSDLYSTDEKIIGTWIDGKPLYQKTLEFTNITISTIQQNIGDISSLNIDFGMITGYVGKEANSNDIYFEGLGQFSCWLRVSDGNIGIQKTINSNPTTFVTLYITICYTKTTDSAVAIGSDTDYSTTEKIIGTWIDGKPLYQKTIAISVPTTTDGTFATNEYALDVSIDNCISIEGYFKSSTSPFNFNIFNRPLANGYMTNVYVKENNILLIENSSSSIGGRDGYVTLKYTKTS